MGTLKENPVWSAERPHPDAPMIRSFAERPLPVGAVWYCNATRDRLQDVDADMVFGGPKTKKELAPKERAQLSWILDSKLAQPDAQTAEEMIDCHGLFGVYIRPTI